MLLPLQDTRGYRYMSRIQEAFSNKKALITFITAGDPNLQMTEELLYTMEEAGSDLIEVGIPFSDPVAEGSVIQAANERALKAGTTTDQVFEVIARARKKVTVPIVFLTYMNPVYTYGTERFMKKCQESGIDGVIIPDVPYEEREEVSGAMKKYGIQRISMIAPTSKERISMIAKEAEGFLYCVSSLGVTGIRSDISTDLQGMLAIAKEVTNVPCAIGFGISTPEQAKEMSETSDGVIVGSAIVKLIGEYQEACLAKVSEYVKTMKEAILKED